ncbi:MAG: hypothetical protein EOP11_17690, partial [Proteobacteria bacterium]
MLTEKRQPEPASVDMDPNAPLDALWSVYPMTLSRLAPGGAERLVREYYRWRKTAARATLSRQFPEFMAAKKWGGENAFLATLCLAEWHIHEVKQEPELPVHGLERIPLANDFDWDHARFFFDPGHRVMESDWNLSEIFQDLGGSHSRSPGKFLVYRHKGTPKVRPLKPSEAELIEALSLGVSLGTIQDRPNG